MSKVTYKDGKNISPNGTVKKRRYWWRYLLVWFSGLVSCVLIIGLVGVIMSTSFTAGQVLGTFGLNVEALLQPYYSGMTILQLATTLPTLKYETLGDIYQITPMVKELILNTINPLLEKELHFSYDWDIISKKPFALPVQEREDHSVDTKEDLSTYIGRAIKEGVYLEDFFTGESIPTLVNLFLYPKDEYGNYDYNNPYSLNDFITAGDTGLFDTIMNSILVKDFVSNPSGDPLLDYIGDWSIKDFDDEHINAMTLGLFIDQSTTDPLMQEISKWTVADLKEGTKFDSLSLGLFLDGESGDPFIEEMGKYTVGDLKKGDFIDSLKISLFIDPDTTDPFMQEIGKYTIGDLKKGDFIDSLSLGLFLDQTSTDPFIKEISKFTIGDLKDGNFIDNLSVGLFLEQESTDPIIQKLSELKISDLKDTDVIKNLFMDLKLGDVVTISETTPQIIATLVNKEYTINDLLNGNLYEDLTISDIFDVTNNRIFTALKDNSLASLENEQTFYNLTLGQVLPATGDTIIAKFKDKTLNEISELDIHDILLTDIFTAQEIEDDPILKSLVSSYPNISIGELSDPDKLTCLKLGDVLTDRSNPIINALVDLNCSISEIPSKINTLTLGTVLDIDVTDPDTPLILKNLANEPINNISNRINTLTLGEMITIDVTDPTTPLLMKTLANKTIDELNDYLPHIKLGDVMDFSNYPNLNNDDVKDTEINDFDALIEVLKDNLTLKDVVDIDELDPNTPKLLKTLSDEWLKDLPDRLNTLTLNEIMTITDSSHPLLIALQNCTFDEFETKIPELTLGDVIEISSSSHPLLKALENKKISELETVIPTLTLGDVIEISATSHPLLIALAGTSLSGLESAIPSIKLKDALQITSSSHPLLKALGEFSLNEIEGEVPNLKLNQIMDIDSSSPKVLQSLADSTISSFSTDITALALEDLITIDVADPDTPPILIALKDVQILNSNNLVEKIKELKLKDIYRKEECGGVFKYLWDDNDHGDLLITQIPTAVNNLPLIKILDEYMYIDDVTLNKYYDVDSNTYYTYEQYTHGDIPSGHEVITYRKISPIYWFLLTEDGETFSNDEKFYVLKKGSEYTINNGLDMLTENFSYHMRSGTLYELYDAGLIDPNVLERSELDTQYIDVHTSSVKIVGNLTMSEFLALCISLLPALPPTP